MHCAPYPEPTQYRGVYLVGDPVEALIPVASEVLNIGSCATGEEAHAAYLEAANKAGESARQSSLIRGPSS